MKLTISTISNLAIYEQITNQIKDAIIKKELSVGDALPSIRALARDLQISVITTKRAYEELEQEGLIESIAGKGFYIRESNTALLQEKQTVLLENRFLPVIKDAKKAGMSLEDMQTMVSLLYETVED